MARQLLPEDVVLNLGKDAPVPPVPDLGDDRAHAWGGVLFNPTVRWLATWKAPLTGERKYAFLPAARPAAETPAAGLAGLGAFADMRMIPS